MPGIRIKVDTDQAERNAKDLRRELDKLGNEAIDTERKMDRLGDGVDKTGKSMKRSQTSVSSLGGMFNKVAGSVSLLAGAYGLQKLASSFINAADRAEQYRTRLTVLLGSQEEGNRLFQEMSKVAAKVPYEYDKIMESATNLAGVMKGGVDEISQWMPMIADLAAASGLTIEDTTGQVIRMYSAGASAADMFREKGILAMMGFQTGVKYSVEETKRMMFEAWEGSASKFKGAADALGKTWTGTLSMLGDWWNSFQRMVMNSGIFDWMKEKANELLTYLNKIKDNGTLKQIVIGIGTAINMIGTSVSTIYSLFMSLWNGFTALISKGVALIFKAIGGVLKLADKAVKFVKKFPLLSKSMKGTLSAYEDALGEAIQAADDLAWAGDKAYSDLSKSADFHFTKVETKMASFSTIHEKVTKKVEENLKRSQKAMSDWEFFQSQGAHSLAENWETNMMAIRGTLPVYEQSVETIKQETSGLVNDVSSIMGDKLSAVFQGEFEGVGKMWDDMVDAMYSSFISMLSNLAKQKVILPVIGGVMSGMFGGVGQAFGGIIPGLGDGGGGFSLAKLGQLFSSNGWLDVGWGISDALQNLGLDDAAEWLTGIVEGNTGWFGAGLSGFGSLGMSLLTGGLDALKSPRTWLQAGGAALGSIFGPLGSGLGGLLGNLIGGLFGPDKPESNWQVIAPGGGFDEEGIFSFAPAYEKESQVGSGYIGNFLKGWGKHTDSDFDKAMVPIYRALDDDITRILDGYADLINETMSDLEDNPEIADAFRQALESIEWDFSFLEDDTSPDEESIQEMYDGILNKFKQSLDDAGYTETVQLFTDLNDVLKSVNPAFQELLSTLSDAVTSYYSPLLQLDQKIVEYGGEDFMLGDLQKQYEAMKLIYDNAVANGATYDQLADIGLKYFDAAEAYQKYFEQLGGTPDEGYQKELDALNEKYAEGMAESVYEAQLKALQDKFADSDFAKLIEDGFESIDLEKLGTDLRDDLTEAFSPEDFNTSVLKTLEDFKIGVQESIDSITKAINELHPNINLDIAVDLDVVGNDVETEYVVTPV